MEATNLDVLIDYYRDYVDDYSNYHPSDTETYLGLAGEVGEVLNVIKKIERDGEVTPERNDELYDELGDVFHYYIRILNKFDIELGDVIEGNMKKLGERYGYEL